MKKEANSNAVAMSDRLREELKRILSQRKSEGYRQKHMAEQLSLSPSAFSRFMSGLTNASTSLIANAMEEFLIDKNYVSTGIREAHPDESRAKQ